MSIENKQCASDGILCKGTIGCDILKAEREIHVESLKNHLSEQRHDFFNLLQVLYGYTQLKKPDKVLERIADYCTQMENIGKLYNCKCIKLADLLYTKLKEAESMDLKLEPKVEISFDPVVRILDEVAAVNAVDNVISGFIYILGRKCYKNSHIIFNLEENADSFHIEIFCKEAREGQYKSISFVIPDQSKYQKRHGRSMMCFDSISKYCSDNGFEGRMLEDGLTFVLNIRRMIGE